MLKAFPSASLGWAIQFNHPASSRRSHPTNTGQRSVLERLEWNKMVYWIERLLSLFWGFHLHSSKALAKRWNSCVIVVNKISRYRVRYRLLNPLTAHIAHIYTRATDPQLFTLYVSRDSNKVIKQSVNILTYRHITITKQYSCQFLPIFGASTASTASTTSNASTTSPAALKVLCCSSIYSRGKITKLMDWKKATYLNETRSTLVRSQRCRCMQLHEWQEMCFCITSFFFARSFVF